MFNIDKKEFTQFIKNLESVAKNAAPKAIRSTFDRMGYLGQKIYKDNIKSNFVIRNSNSNIILKSIRYEKCPNTLNIPDMLVRIGQKETTYGKTTDQLRKQEFGEYLYSKGFHIMKPTKAARGGNYKKAVQKGNLLSDIRAYKIEDLIQHPAKNEFQQFRQAIGYARHNPGNPFYLITDENYFGIRGIARIDGSKEAKSAEFLYSIKEKSQKLNAVKSLTPVGKMVGDQADTIFKREAERRIKRELNKKR